MFTIDNQIGRILLWRLRLEEFYFDIKDKKVKSNKQSDTLSRLLTESEIIPDQDYDDILALFVEIDEVNQRLLMNRDEEQEEELLYFQNCVLDKCSATFNDIDPAHIRNIPTSSAPKFLDVSTGEEASF